MFNHKRIFFVFVAYLFSLALLAQTVTPQGPVLSPPPSTGGGSGGSGTVSVGTEPQAAYYAANGNTVSAQPQLQFRSGANVFNFTNSDIDFNVRGTSLNTLIWGDAALNRIGFGTATPVGFVDINAGSVTTGIYPLNVAGTLPNPGGTAEIGVAGAFTVNGAGTSQPIGGFFSLSGTYSGATGGSYGLVGINNLPGGAATSLSGVSRQGNFAIEGNAQGAGTGDNAGGYFLASAAPRNIGIISLSTGAKVNALNIGVFGESQNGGGGTEKHIGGMFSVDNTGATDPVFESAALIADNRLGTAPIFLGRDDGIVQFRLANSGVATFNDNSNATADLNVKGDTDTDLFFVDVSADRVGVSTSTPTTTFEVDGTTTSTIFRGADGTAGTTASYGFTNCVGCGLTYNNGSSEMDLSTSSTKNIVVSAGNVAVASTAVGGDVVVDASDGLIMSAANAVSIGSTASSVSIAAATKIQLNGGVPLVAGITTSTSAVSGYFTLFGSDNNTPGAKPTCSSKSDQAYGSIIYWNDANDGIDGQMCMCNAIAAGEAVAWRLVASPSVACP